MGKTRTLYHRDNKSPRTGRRLEKLVKHMEKIEKMAKQGIVSEAWVKDAKGKAAAKCKRYGMNVA